jgi:hypothetical protein
VFEYWKLGTHLWVLPVDTILRDYSSGCSGDGCVWGDLVMAGVGTVVWSWLVWGLWCGHGWCGDCGVGMAGVGTMVRVLVWDKVRMQRSCRLSDENVQIHALPNSCPEWEECQMWMARGIPAACWG